MMNQRKTIFPLLSLLLLLVTGIFFWFAPEAVPIEPLTLKENSISSVVSTPSISYTTGSFIDKRDEEKYQWIKYEDGKKWMAQNLRYQSTNSVCYNKEDSCAQFGQLYNWEAAQQVCPIGWRLPSQKEWLALVERIGDEKAQFDILTSSSNESFAATLGGVMNSKGVFDFIGENGNYWTASREGKQVWYINFSKALKQVFPLQESKELYFSCRCIEGDKKRQFDPVKVAATIKSTPTTTTVAPTKSPENSFAKNIIEGTIQIEALIESKGSYRPVRLQKSNETILAADLKIGKKGTSRTTSPTTISTVSSQPNENLAAYRFSFSGTAYTLLIGFNKKGQLHTYYPQETNYGNYTASIEADLKIGKRPSKKNKQAPTVLVKETKEKRQVAVEESIDNRAASYPIKVVFVSANSIDSQEVLDKIRRLDPALSLPDKLEEALGNRYEANAVVSIKGNTISYNFQKGDDAVVPIVINMN